jgi:intracellular sulfur oxidation DsrE/DsrF family protein
MKVRNVKVFLCDKTRDEIALDPAKVYDGVKMTPSGVVTIADMQSQGFSYLKIQ